jgi:anti-sigma regulatory factor (Ser/Thr protein kinase)
MDVNDTRLELPAQPTSPRQARHFVGGVLRDHGVRADDVVEAALLLTSELVTNAVLHAAGAINVEVDIDLRGVRVEVADCSGEAPLPQPADLDETSGRGLHLVAELARAWGVEQTTREGKVVWFELDSRVAAER